MAIYVTYLIIFLLGAVPFVEVTGVIPIGVAMGLPALPVMIIGVAGNIGAIWLVMMMATHVRSWLVKRQEEKGVKTSDKKSKRAEAIWKKYGLQGLTIISPILIGSHLGVLLAISFGSSRYQVFMWMTMSLLFWTITVGVASHYGMDFLLEKTGYQGILSQFLK